MQSVNDPPNRICRVLSNYNPRALSRVFFTLGADVSPYERLRPFNYLLLGLASSAWAKIF
jgi:hypothetical protein